MSPSPDRRSAHDQGRVVHQAALHPDEITIRDGTPVLRITDRRLRNDAAGVFDDLTALGA